MEYLPVGLFAVAAVGGLTLVTMKFTGKGMPLPLALAHGVFAAAGLVALIVRILENGGNVLMNVSLVLFLAVALGGFILLTLHLKGRRQPAILIAAHALGAVASFIVLLVAVSG